MESLKGHLLLASPALFDPNFRRTVVLITEHNEEGAAGIVLNRPSDIEVAEAVPSLAELVDAGTPVWVGGPVEQRAVLALGEFDDPDDAAAIVTGDVGFLPGDPQAALAAQVRRARVYAGYSGWASGQLEAELEQGSWLVEPAEGVDLFPEPDEDLWGGILRRKGGAFRVLALMPEDPSQN